MILVAIAALLGVVIGLALPKISPSIGEITGEYIASGPAAVSPHAASEKSVAAASSRAKIFLYFIMRYLKA